MPREAKQTRKRHTQESKQRKKYAPGSETDKKNKQETRKGHTRESEQEKKYALGIETSKKRAYQRERVREKVCPGN